MESLPTQPAPSGARYTVLRRRVVLLGVLVILGLVVGTCYGLWRSYRETLDATTIELSNLARALSEQTAWTWETIDVFLRDIGQWYVTDGRAQPVEAIDRVLAERVAGVRQIHAVHIADADGLQRYRSDGRVPHDLDVSKRSYFTAIRDGTAAGLFITEPLVSRSGQRNTVVLSRRLEDSQGRFLGVVTASLDFQTLRSLYGSVRLGPGNAIALFREDGTLLVRNPPIPDLVGAKFPPAFVTADATPVLVNSRVDGSRQFAAITHVRDAPLVLAVARREDVALSSWRHELWRALGRTILLALLAALSVVALVRQLNRIEAGERALLESRERQAQSQKLEALGSLAGGIAHDFNNILGAILGYGELAQRQAAPGEPLRRYVDNMMRAAERARLLVDRILGFSRSGMSERVPVNIQCVVEETLELLAPSLPPEIRLERELLAGNAAVIGDATRLHQVSMNLCTNAVKAMPNGGTLRVRLERSVVAEPVAVTRGGLSRGPYALLTVSDTGVGMAPALLERVFEPFFTTKGIGEGTGLGLSLVDGIVQDLGGAIAVTSRPGEGSTFALWLPVTGETARPVTGSAPELPPGRGETVMVVDDEPMLVSLAEEMLAGLGYEPVGFGSAVAALEAFRLAPGRFDALLTDENMPGLGGIALACELRAIQPGLAVVLMSGYGGARLGERAAAAGLSEVLRKPLQRRDLSQALAAVLHAREPASFPNTLSP